MTAELIVVALLALLLGAAIGWVLGGRRGHGLAADLAAANARAGDADLVRQARDAVERERNDAMQDNAALRAREVEREIAYQDALRQLKELAGTVADLSALKAEHAARQAEHLAQSAAKEDTIRRLQTAQEAMTNQFNAAAAKALDTAQKQFLDRAHARFAESEQMSGQRLQQLLQPVTERLQRYEEGVKQVEAERRDAFGDLKGQIEAMRVGQEKVSSEAAKLVNSLRNAPKARGRWGEQQLRNVLESCGLSEHADFQTEVSVGDGEGGRLRPDVIIRIPGGQSLVIDAKVSLNAYQDAYDAVDEVERKRGLDAHAAAIRAHVNGLANKTYWDQFADAPDYVVMFIPGEHLLSAALEQDQKLWEFAFEKKVLLATPTNLIAIARTIAAVWRQEKLAKEAREIGVLGKELYDRLAKAMGDLRTVGSGLNTAVKNYNTFVNSLETRALVSARKLRDYNLEPSKTDLGVVPAVELLAGHVTSEMESVALPDKV